MRLGIHLPQFREPVDGAALTAFAAAAERGGADDLWVSDHVVLPAGSTSPPERFHDALTVLTWAAAATTRARLGTSVLVAPYRNPVLLARTIASLDALSGGRVVLGLGSGWMREEFAALGVDHRRRGRLTDETITVCRRLWDGHRDIDRDGGRLSGMVIRPGPARRGGPPIWIGGDSDAGIARAVRLGDAWHTTISDRERLAERVGTLESALAAAGRDRDRFVLSVRVRADLERLRRVVPRLASLGVDHVLVDCPVEDGPSTEARVRAIRRVVQGAAP